MRTYKAANNIFSMTQHGETQIVEIAHLYIQSLSSYTMLLAFFFQLASSPNMLADPSALLAHPVVERLSQLKQALVEMKNLGLFEPRLEEADVDDSDRVMGKPTEEDAAYEELGDLEPNEIQDLIFDEKENQAESQRQSHRSVSASATKPATAKSWAMSEKTKKQLNPRASVPTQPSVLADVADVDVEDNDGSPQLQRARRPSSHQLLESEDAFGEPSQMRDAELHDKAQRKRAVQFHATGLETKPTTSSTKKTLLEGDADIPYRDKKQIRDAVSTAKANRLAKGMEKADTSLSETDWGESDWRTRDEVMRDDAVRGEDEDDETDGDDSESGKSNGAAAYYDLVSSRKRARKAEKKDEYDRQRLANRVYDDDVLGPGEHRSIDYAMEKNKGLTANRPNSVRNPRVKRRLRYDRAKKRLSSTRAVYKGGQSALQGGYAGEKSGISTNLVKSRKLGS